MKTFTARLQKMTIHESIKALDKAVRSGVPFLHGDELFCDSVESMMANFSRARIEAFAAIVTHRPNSLKELANILKKDLGNISRDVGALELLGLIELHKDSKTDPRAIRPVALYDQIAFDFSSTRKKSK